MQYVLILDRRICPQSIQRLFCSNTADRPLSNQEFQGSPRYWRKPSDLLLNRSVALIIDVLFHSPVLHLAHGQYDRHVARRL